MDDLGLAGTALAGRYDVLALLGSGGMGAVYRARDRELDEEVALKVVRDELAAEPHVLERFRREVKLARRVTHRNVARTFELGHAGGLLFCTMELIDGETLHDRLRRVQRLAAAEAVAIARELCDGLAAAHAAGVIHRDIKPANVLIARDGRVVLADFGVAAVTLASAREIAGTLAYMAPEQARGEPATPASDVYALGELVYEMVTGRRPFPGTPDEIRIAKGHPLALDGLPGDLANLVARATAPDPAARTASAVELARALGTLASAAPVAPPTGTHAAPRLHTVIVLPPRARAEAHLVNGLHEELLARLARLPRVRVLPRTSATAEPADTIVELVATEAVVATISRAAGAPLELHLPLAVGELAAGAEAIASAVAFVVDEPARRPPPEAAGAQDLLLRARELIRHGFMDMPRAIEMLERARALDPGDPRIVAALAIAHVRKVFIAPAGDEELAHARRLVDEALARAPELAETRLAAGQLELNGGEPWRAASHFREAIAAAPHAPDAHEYLGRMLLEAGQLEPGVARLEDALAIAPQLGSSRWDLARMWALEGGWQACDALIAEAVAVGNDRVYLRARIAWWRQDRDALAAIHARLAELGGETPLGLFPAVETVVTGAWPRRRDELIALATTPRQNRRRKALVAQVVAEVAALSGDGPTALALVEQAVAAGMYDAHWLERCPVLDPARGERGFAAIRRHVSRRAHAVLDAMYGDDTSAELSETVVL